MKDALDKDLDKTIQRLKNLEKESDTQKKSRIKIIESSTEVPKRQEIPKEKNLWDSKNSALERENWDTQNSSQIEETGITLTPPGQRGKRLYHRFSFDISGERVLEILLLLVTIGGVLCIIFNFETITRTLALGLANIFIGIGKIVIFILMILICIAVARLWWRSRRPYRRR